MSTILRLCVLLIGLTHLSEAYGEPKQTAESMNLFSVFLTQPDKQALDILTAKAGDHKVGELFETTNNQWCASEEVRSKQGEFIWMNGSCLRDRYVRIQPQVGELKEYVVEFLEQYETAPGKTVVSGIRYKHSWDTDYIKSMPFDPYQIMKDRFGDHDRKTSSTCFVWDFVVEGNAAFAELCDFSISRNRYDKEYSIEINYPRDVLNAKRDAFDEYVKRKVSSDSATKPDF